LILGSGEADVADWSDQAADSADDWNDAVYMMLIVDS